ncbi:MAG: lysophospholipid acyltransferase family protein [candidate division KSB1 bacterium]|nr:lysophospholipid acyltransferase family protein [candidate division KSB1 bacterium]
MKRSRRIVKRVKNWFIYQIVRYGFRMLNGMQRETAINLLGTLGGFGYHIVGSERKKTIRNLKRVFGERFDDDKIRRMGKEVFVNLGRNMADAFRVSGLNPDNIDSIVTAEGLEKIDELLARGKGLISLTGHVGNWELLGAYLAMKGYPLSVVGAPIYDPRLDEMVTRNRVGSGLGYIQRGSATREILRVLRRNEMVGILIDQDTRHVQGVFVDFLGMEAYTPVGPVILALKTGSPLLPIGIHMRRDNTHHIAVGEEITLGKAENKDEELIMNTLKCSKAVEQFIHDHPTQWVWMHNRWKTKKKQ